MPDDTPERSADTDRKATENVLTQKFGPLPLFVWVALGAGILGAFILLKKKGAAPASAQPVGVPGTQGGGGSSSGGADTSGFVSSSQEATDIASVGQQISDLSKSVTDQLAGVQANETALGTGIANTNTTLTQTQAGLSSLGSTVAGLNSGQSGATGASRSDLAQLASEVQALAGSGTFAGQSSVAAIGANAGSIASRNNAPPPPSGGDTSSVNTFGAGSGSIPIGGPVGTPAPASVSSQVPDIFSVLTANNGSPAAGVSRDVYNNFVSSKGRNPNDAYELASFAGK